MDTDARPGLKALGYSTTPTEGGLLIDDPAQFVGLFGRHTEKVSALVAGGPTRTNFSG